MSLLIVCVKKARLHGQAASFHTYVCLKLQNVKSNTVAVQSDAPSWEQDFMFETQRLDIGLTIELWNKGMLWDKLLGTFWLPLTRIQHSNQEGEGKWFQMDAEILMRQGEVVGTQSPTGHYVLIDARFELPYDLPDAEAEELQSKLEILNDINEQGIAAMHEQHRRALSQCMSEDSDYTSDYNLPLQHQHNQPAFQYRSEHLYGHQYLPGGAGGQSSGLVGHSAAPCAYGGGHQTGLAADAQWAHEDDYMNDGRLLGRRFSRDLDDVSPYHHRSGSPGDHQHHYSTGGDMEEPLYYNSRPQPPSRPLSRQRALPYREEEEEEEDPRSVMSPNTPATAQSYEDRRHRFVERYYRTGEGDSREDSYDCSTTNYDRRTPAYDKQYSPNYGNSYEESFDSARRASVNHLNNLRATSPTEPAEVNANATGMQTENSMDRCPSVDQRYPTKYGDFYYNNYYSPVEDETTASPQYYPSSSSHLDDYPPSLTAGMGGPSFANTVGPTDRRESPSRSPDYVRPPPMRRQSSLLAGHTVLGSYRGPEEMDTGEMVNNRLDNDLDGVGHEMMDDDMAEDGEPVYDRLFAHTPTPANAGGASMASHVPPFSPNRRESLYNETSLAERRTSWQQHSSMSRKTPSPITLGRYHSPVADDELPNGPPSAGSVQQEMVGAGSRRGSSLLLRQTSCSSYGTGGARRDSLRDYNMGGALTDEVETPSTVVHAGDRHSFSSELPGIPARPRGSISSAASPKMRASFALPAPDSLHVEEVEEDVEEDEAVMSRPTSAEMLPEPK